MLEEVNRLINSKKIKYTVLDTLFNRQEFSAVYKPGTMINFFIDIESISKHLFASNFRDDIYNEISTINNIADESALTAFLLNYIGHYRHYFASRLGCPSRYILFYSFQKDKRNLDLEPTYREHYYKTRLSTDNDAFNKIRSNIEYNLNLIKNIIKYIPDCYIYDTGDLNHMLIPSYIMNVNSSERALNIINTDNVEIYGQDIFYNRNCFLLEMKSDNSKLLGYNNILTLIKDHHKLAPADIEAVQPSALVFLFMLISHKKYLNLPSYKKIGYKRGLQICKNLSADLDTINSVFLSIDGFANLSLIDSSLEKFVPNFYPEDFNLRYKILNHWYQIVELQDKLADLIDKNTINLVDPESLKKLNDMTMFEKNPIILEYLFQGYDLNKFSYYN